MQYVISCAVLPKVHAFRRHKYHLLCTFGFQSRHLNVMLTIQLIFWSWVHDVQICLAFSVNLFSRKIFFIKRKLSLKNQPHLFALHKFFASPWNLGFCFCLNWRVSIHNSGSSTTLRAKIFLSRAYTTMKFNFISSASSSFIFPTKLQIVQIVKLIMIFP